MTKISERKSRMTGESNTIVRVGSAHRPLLVEVTPHSIIVRPKGLGPKSAFSVPLQSVYETGAQLAAIAAKKKAWEEKVARESSRV